MKGAYLAAALLGAAMASPLVARDCANDCDNTHNQCINNGTNRSACDSDLASCKDKCSPTPSPSPSSEDAPFQCIRKCAEGRNTCQAAAGGDTEDCENKYGTCRNNCPQYTPTPSPSPPGNCKAQCQESGNECRTKPGANLSTCESELRACETKCPQPPASSTKVNPEPTPGPPGDCVHQCQKADDACRGKPGANLTTCASDLSKCEDACPHPPASTTAPAPTNTAATCEQKCEVADSQCRTKPGANLSTCASDLTNCKAACGKPPASTGVAPKPTPTASCEDKCSNTRNECITKPGANKSTCDPDFEKCKSDCKNQHPVISAGAAFKPVIAMVVAGVLAIAMFKHSLLLI